MEQFQVQKKYSIIKTVLLAFLGISLFTGSLYLAYKQFSKIQTNFPNHISPAPKPQQSANLKLQKFNSEEEFKEYLEKNSYQESQKDAGLRNPAIPESQIDSTFDSQGVSLKSSPSRVSKTNVQVIGIDEPDIVKTDGDTIYYSGQNIYRSSIRLEPMVDEKVLPPNQERETKLINAFPPANLKIDGEINKQGNLLIIDNMLIIFESNAIYGYNVSDPENPDQKWKIDLNNNNKIVDARLLNNQIYLVTQETISHGRPCPISPMSIGGKEISIKCTDIYYPSQPVPVDVAFTAFKINPSTGDTVNKTSFVGSSGNSIIYMSPNALYTTYSYYEDMVDFFYNFLSKEALDLVDQETLNRLNELRQYEISNSSKLNELQIILEQWQNSLDKDERLKVENELSNRLDSYFQKHQRELETTGIAKLNIDNFSIQATGSVPGKPLNQFSLDEYKNNLRIATTTGNNRMLGTSSESVNDVYILDKNLNQLSSVKNMGLDERIYSVRFINDKGYVVTFKQIDPFYVLDLSNPQLPKLTGELKIPGYSSYLHPLEKNRILGVGKENNQVKISIFNVADPENPIEEDKYLLDEYWSDILNTHHAFLLDKRHEVFFLPGNKGGYIFSYKKGQIELTKAVSEINPQRALYLDDYLYLIGNQKIVVLNEVDWNRVNELEF